MDVKETIGFGLRPASNEIAKRDVDNYARVLVALGVVDPETAVRIVETYDPPASAFDALYDLEVKSAEIR